MWRRGLNVINVQTLQSSTKREYSTVGGVADSQGRRANKGQNLLITQLLQLFKQNSDTRQYLKYYGSAGKDRFAIIRVSGDVLHNRDHLYQTAASLSFLHRVGLRPIVVHGAGIYSGRCSDALSKIVNAETSIEESEPGQSERDMLHVDESKQLKASEAAVEYMEKANAALVETLSKEFDIGAVPLIDTVYRAKTMDNYSGPKVWERLAGSILSVNNTVIESAFRQGLIPIVSSLGWGVDCHRLLSFSTQEATSALAKAFSPLKVIMLRPEGCLRDEDGNRFKYINLARDLLPLSRNEPTENGVRLLEGDRNDFNDAANTFSSLDVGATLAITTPALLSQELFTHQGAGTLIVRGDKITRITDLNSPLVDLPAVKAVLEGSFRSPIPDSYFESIQDSFRSLYVTESGRGIAIVLTIGGIPYLDKIAVQQGSQGDQLGEQIWQALTKGEPSLFWRSRSSNSANNWYYDRAHGAIKDQKSPWTVFWYNVDTDKIMECVKKAIGLKPTFSV
ncbi:hypothetical protein, variant 1 [Sphaeroforma arctica JP610]|uniref:N-acetyltransferase domain-containing protein n=1 Tax=Sphaeroforma arctica JP610 TaxID=667725 RepID=A0A0L0G306_9EUKA|nr:hypothetical protein, variant 2 [Sphaeroforma arctica JP610]XP_014157131.1 hypothetical protein, variant 1 [Sphaeroforma arctica JP610]KNC83228.1 hypothetical protein, variant 2 [Sphaeroforma arctica JP610]KNC83229.1 hypothetical protein, variant 1 [Sphaeroforma arctica JP610]|eukprot:XP_014157130.1 hypothetical protein, variant 2 [Sphaeroforma arctica JP610]